MNSKTVLLPEKITIDNASRFFGDLTNNIQDTPGISLILDAQNLEYISSVGLREILKLLKRNYKVQVINASGEVYNVFGMTGLNKLFPIERKREFISTENLQQIGRGQTGQIYKIDDETIVKKFNSNIPPEYIKNEQKTAQKAFLSGIPTAITFNIIDVDENQGIKYELLNAHTFLELCHSEPEKRDDYIRQFASLMRETHQIQLDVDVFDNKKEIALNRLYENSEGLLTEAEIKKVAKLYETIPDRNTFIHGDFNPGNVMLSRGEPLLIDMGQMGYGHPIFELATFYTSFKLPTETIKPTKLLFRFSKEETKDLFDLFIKSYFGTEDEAFLKQATREIKLRSEYNALLSGSFVPDLFSKEDLARFKEDVLRAADQGLKPIEW